MRMNETLTEEELMGLGFSQIGTNVRIDRRAALFGAEHMAIGSFVRIDAFSVITAGPAKVVIGSFTHIAAHTYLSGAQGGITMGYGAGIAPFAALYSAVEDYTSGHLTNPSVPEDMRLPRVGPVTIGAHTAIGSSSVVLCDTRLGFGSSVGALSFVTRSVRPFEVVHGNPIRRVGVRAADPLMRLDADLRARAKTAGCFMPDPLPAP
jgi:galactoside O-acetyltransferase